MNHKKVLNKDKTGYQIRKYMIQHKYSYDYLAELLNLASSRVIYDWVNGLKLPSLEHLILLSSIFKVKLEDILFVEDVF